MASTEAIQQALEQKGIRPSHQREMMLEYLLENRTHPTADEIYWGLHQKDKTISKATVYNALDLFERKDIVRSLNVGGGERHYDIATNDHGHFLCTNCGKIRDFCINIENCETDLPEDYDVQRADVHFFGLCDACRAAQADGSEKTNTNKEELQ